MVNPSAETQEQSSVGSGEKVWRKFSSTGGRAPWVPTLTRPFPNGQPNAGSCLGTKSAVMKMFFLCSISEQHLQSSFHAFVHYGYCLPILIRFIHQDCAYIQGKLSFSLFLTRKEGNTGDTGKHFRCY